MLRRRAAFGPAAVAVAARPAARRPVLGCLAVFRLRRRRPAAVAVAAFGTTMAVRLPAAVF